MKLFKYPLTLSVGAMTLLVSVGVFANGTELKTSQPQQLNELISLALSQDHRRKQLHAQSLAIRETGVASSTLKDPKLKVGVGGLPVDSFDFDQDPMTNISIGLMQEFERGSTLELQQKQIEQQAQGSVFQVEIRELQVINKMTQLWLELGYQQKVEHILLENKRLMMEMEKFIDGNYALGKSEAQDLLGAQIQISKLDEKLQANKQMQGRIVSQFSEWLGANWGMETGHLKASVELDWHKLQQKLSKVSDNQYYVLLASHPMSKVADTQIAANKTQISIAEEAYSPKFGVEVMYAYRQADAMDGGPASDLLSAYLTMDIPIFTDKRQDRKHVAAQYQVVEAQSNKALILARMNAQVNTLLVDKDNLEQRLQRYKQTILPQLKQKTQAIERAYHNNSAQFNEVINAAREELSLEIEKWRLVADLNMANSHLAYLLVGFEYSVEQPSIALDQ